MVYKKQCNHTENTGMEASLECECTATDRALSTEPRRLDLLSDQAAKSSLINPADTHIFSRQFDTGGIMFSNLCVCKLGHRS